PPARARSPSVPRRVLGPRPQSGLRSADRAGDLGCQGNRGDNRPTRRRRELGMGAYHVDPLPAADQAGEASLDERRAGGRIVSTMAVIEVEALHKEFRRLRGGRTIAVDGLDLSVPDGGVFGFLGLNGAGKTT